MKPQIILVDEADRLVGYKDRALVDHNDIYRVSALWLTDSKTGDTLLAQRKRTKKHDPGKWSTAAAGTNDKGETYEQNMIKEAYEELGLKDVRLRLGPRQFVDSGQHRMFCQWFLAQVDKDTVTITIQDEELEGVRWMSIAELIRDVELHPEAYIASMKVYLPALIEHSL